MKTNLFTITRLTIILVVCMMITDFAFGQVNNVLTTAETSLTQQSVTLRSIFGIIFMILCGGAILYAAYAAFFDSNRLKGAMIGLLVGLLLGGVGAAMTFLN